VTHAVCGVHLLRELTAAAETTGRADWANALDRLLCEINRTTSPPGLTGSPPELVAGYRRRYNDLIAVGWAANPRPRTRRPRPQPQTGPRQPARPAR
jgi:transposase